MTANQITVIGNLTRKPTLRHTPTGLPVADLTVAENFRRRDRASGEWRDVAKTYYTVSCWRQLAEHVAQTLDKGHPVVVVGRLYIDEWADRNGVLRRTPKIDPISVGYDLRFSSVLAPVRPASNTDRETDRETDPLARSADDWDEPPAAESEEFGDPFGPEVGEESEGYRAVSVVPASEG